MFVPPAKLRRHASWAYSKEIWKLASFLRYCNLAFAWLPSWVSAPFALRRTKSGSTGNKTVYFSAWLNGNYSRCSETHQSTSVYYSNAKSHNTESIDILRIKQRIPASKHRLIVSNKKYKSAPPPLHSDTIQYISKQSIGPYRAHLKNARGILQHTRPPPLPSISPILAPSLSAPCPRRTRARPVSKFPKHKSFPTHTTGFARLNRACHAHEAV